MTMCSNSWKPAASRRSGKSLNWKSSAHGEHYSMHWTSTSNRTAQQTCLPSGRPHFTKTQTWMRSMCQPSASPASGRTWRTWSLTCSMNNFAQRAKYVLTAWRTVQERSCLITSSWSALLSVNSGMMAKDIKGRGCWEPGRARKSTRESSPSSERSNQWRTLMSKSHTSWKRRKKKRRRSGHRTPTQKKCRDLMF